MRRAIVGVCVQPRDSPYPHRSFVPLVALTLRADFWQRRGKRVPFIATLAANLPEDHGSGTGERFHARKFTTT